MMEGTSHTVSDLRSKYRMKYGSDWWEDPDVKGEYDLK